jgi:RHS repeat-associated protein
VAYSRNKTVWQAPQVAVPSFWSLASLSETACIPQPLTDAPLPPYLAHPAQQYTDPGLPLALSTSFENIARYPQNARIAIVYDELPVPGGSVWTHFPAQAQWNALTPTGRVRNLKGREAAVAYRQHAGEPYHFVVMSYDERGRLEALLRYTENLGFDAVYYTYNSMNTVTSVRVVDPQRQYTTWYGYNTNGKVDSVWTKLSAVGTGFGISNPAYRAPERRGRDADIVYTYTKRWQVDKMFYPLIATQVAYAYNGRMLMDSMVATRNSNVVFRQVLKYDSLDCITNQKWQHTGRNETEYTYLYNKHKWLESAFETGGRSQTYYYDAVGNRRSQTDATYMYNDPVGRNRLTRGVHFSGVPINYFDTTDYSYNANGAVIGKVSRDGTRTITETMGYDNIVGQMNRYMRTEGGVSEDWRYRSNAMGEREQKRQYATTQSPVWKWMYYLLSPTRQQLAVYKGIETKQTSCGTTADNFVYMYAAEYNSFGIGDVHNLTVRPQPGGTSKKEYAIQDHLGSTRVVLDGYGGIISQSDYKPFGEVAWQSGQEARTGYVDKERDEESSLQHMGVRKYETAHGRFLMLDPMWEQFRSITPYNYCFNNPLVLKDPTGDVPYTFIVRSFHPDTDFGFGFHADNRGFSSSMKVTSRVKQHTTLETGDGSLDDFAKCDVSYHPLGGTRRAKPRHSAEMTNMSFSDGVSEFTFQTEYAAHNPLIPSPDIDVSATFYLREDSKNGLLSISAKIVGDGFPSAEALIMDSKEQTIMLGTHAYVGSVATSLWGKGQNNMIQANFSITVDSDGNFTGVVSNGKIYTIGEWNKKMESRSPRPADAN